MDDIELPPLKPLAYDISKWANDHARAAVLADRERRKKPERVVHRKELYLAADGSVCAFPSSAGCFIVRFRWTDDGRAGIESEKNRELAAKARKWADVDNDSLSRDLREMANALDGGQHV